MGNRVSKPLIVKKVKLLKNKMSKFPEELKNNLGLLLKEGDLDKLLKYVEDCCRYFSQIAFFEGKLDLKKKIEKDLKTNIEKDLSHYLGDWEILDNSKLKRVRNKSREALVEAFVVKLLEENL